MSWSVRAVGSNKGRIKERLRAQKSLVEDHPDVLTLIEAMVDLTKIPDGGVIDVQSSGHYYNGMRGGDCSVKITSINNADFVDTDSRPNG